MKVIAVSTLLLAVQVSATFFDGFQSAFVSVENSFGKLLSDVVSDVKVTIDCTVVAVENALSLGGMFGDHSDYERRCRGESANNQPIVVQNTNLDPPTVVYDSITDDSVTVPPVDSGKQSVKREIQSSMANVDNTIKNNIEKSKRLDELKTIKTTLKKDTRMLDNVSSSLTKQLNDITSNVKEEVEQIGADSASTVNEMLNKISIMHKVTDQNSDAASSQIRHAFDEVMDAIHSNSTTVNLANDTTAKEIMKQLEQTSNNTFTDIKTTYSQFRNEENKHLDGLKDIVESKTKVLLKSKMKTSVNDESYDSKDIVARIVKDLPNTKPNTSVNKASESHDLKDIVASKVKDLPHTKPNMSVNKVSESYDLKDIVASKVKDLPNSKPNTSVNKVSESYDLKDIVASKVKDLLSTKSKKSVNKVSESYDLKDIVESKVKDLPNTKLNKSVVNLSESYDLKDIVESKTKDLVKSKPKETVNEPPKSFKTLAQQIIAEKPHTVVTTEKNIESVTEAPIPITANPPVDDSEPMEDPEILFNEFFASSGQDGDSDNEAMSLIQRSRYSQMLMSSVFSSNSGESVFDNPELLNYR